MSGLSCKNTFLAVFHLGARLTVCSSQTLFLASFFNSLIFLSIRMVYNDIQMFDLRKMSRSLRARSSQVLVEGYSSRLTDCSIFYIYFDMFFDLFRCQLLIPDLTVETRSSKNIKEYKKVTNRSSNFLLDAYPVCLSVDRSVCPSDSFSNPFAYLSICSHLFVFRTSVFSSVLSCNYEQKCCEKSENAAIFGIHTF